MLAVVSGVVGCKSNKIDNASRASSMTRKAVIRKCDELVKTVYFDLNSDETSSQCLEAARHQAGYLVKSGASITLVGHCDERASSEYNIVLGLKRAKAIKKILIQYGVAPEKISVQSKGKEELVDHGTDEHAHAANRRVEFINDDTQAQISANSDSDGSREE